MDCARNECSQDPIIKPTLDTNKFDLEEDDIDSPKMSKPAAKKTPTKASVKKDGIPPYSYHTYPYKCFERCQVVIKTPAAFIGMKDTYKLFVENKDTLVLKVAVDDVLFDPHHIHSYHTSKYGCIFGEDSFKTHQWKQSADNIKGKYSTFRLKLPFSCQKKFSDDLANPGVDWTIIEKKYQIITFFMIWTKSPQAQFRLM